MLIFLLVLNLAVFSHDDTVIKAMRDELKRNLTRLKDSNFSLPYFISYSVYDYNSCGLDAVFGEISNRFYYRNRFAKADLRVGTPEFDNSNFITDLNRYMPFYFSIPVEDNYFAVRAGLWYLTDEVYKNACEVISRKKAYIEKKEIKQRYPEISSAPVAVYLSDKDLSYSGCSQYVDVLKKISLLPKKYPEIKSAEFSLNVFNNVMRFADSENRYFRKLSSYTVIEADVEFQDLKGYVKKDRRNFIYRDFDDFQKKAFDEIDFYLKNFSYSYDSDEIDYFAGPAVFEYDASAQFFNVMFVRNISFYPAPETENEDYLKYYYDIPRFADKIGRKVLASFFDVYDDARLKNYNNYFLAGSYEIDDEGIIPQRVELVKNGVLKALYCSRRPSKYFSASNGRGRGSYNMYVYPFPSNVFFDSKKRFSDDRFMEEVKKYLTENGYDEVVFIERISDYSDNDSSDLPKPLVAWIFNFKTGEKRYITNVDFESTGLRILKEIEFTSERDYVYNFFEKGPFYNSPSLPASVIVPEKIFIREVEIVRSNTKPQKKPYISHPYFKK